MFPLSNDFWFPIRIKSLAKLIFSRSKGMFELDNVIVQQVK